MIPLHFKQWLLVAAIVGATAASDLLQSHEMKRHGEIQEFHPGRLGGLLAGLARRINLVLSIVFMAVSFFAFLTLLSIADLSFAVPATAFSFVVETFLAKYVLKEQVGAARWAGVGLVACGVALLAL
jgi:drug/metabolite transporter (DMT)-like permease